MALDQDPRPGTHDLRDTVLATLGIELVAADAGEVSARMMVGPHVHQPYGYLHGGVSVVLAETVMSIGASIAAGYEYEVFGMEINANHLRPMREGVITAVGTPLYRGRTSQVWQAELRDEQQRLICISRCTLAVRKRQDGSGQSTEVAGA